MPPPPPTFASAFLNSQVIELVIALQTSPSSKSTLTSKGICVAKIRNNITVFYKIYISKMNIIINNNVLHKIPIYFYLLHIDCAPKTAASVAK